MNGSLFGKSFAHWAEVGDVMEKHTVKTAKALDAKLSKPDNTRIEVRDSKNTDRVLGTVDRPRGNSPRLDGGDCYNMAVMPKLSLEPPTWPPMKETVAHVRFGLRCIDWNVVLITDAPLSLLVQLDSFRLPGETADQAHVRQMYA